MRSQSKMPFLLIVLLIFSVFTTQAQDDIPPDCDIDLVNIIADLAEAQRDADTGSPTDALETIEDIRDELNDLLAECLPAPPIDEAVTTTPDLPESQVSTDGSHAFNHPAGWVVQQLEENLTFVGTSEVAISFFLEDPEEPLPNGEQAVAVFFVEGTEFVSEDEADDFNLLVEAIRGDLNLDDDTAFTSPATELTVNDRQAARFTAQSPNFDALVILLNYLERDRIALLLGVSTREELDSLESTMIGMAQSFQSPVELSNEEDIDWDGELDFVRIASLDDLTDSFRPTATLAPDGSALIWHDDTQLCLYTFSTTSTDCFNIPESFQGNPTTLRWSPDSRYVAFTPDFYRSLEEPDIWLFDVGAGTLFNRTEDGVDDSPMMGNSDSVNIDVEPIWHPDGDLYFLRINRETEGLGLFRMSPDGTEAPEQVTELGDDFLYLSLFTSSDFQLAGSMAFSPGGDLLAMNIRDRDNESNDGIWLMDISDNAPPRRIAPLDDFYAALPNDVQENGDPFFIEGLDWADDGRGLYAVALTPISVPGLSIPYYIDTDSGQVTPLLDLSGTTLRELAENASEPDSVYGLMPFNSVIPMGSDFAFGASSSSDRSQLIIGRYTPEGLEVVESRPVTDQAIPSLYASASRDGKLLIFDTIYQIGNTQP